MIRKNVFKNNVLRVNTKQWMNSSLKRALRTIAQAMIAGIGTAAYMGQVEWKYVISMACLSGVLSLLTSIAGLPEVPTEEKNIS